ncbi:MAG: FtsW/RodA/SpoVE family cell cycle protein [Actinobacteria bacterium]|nr:FtsW/RodA/SpoVE family cell cycle protein [Actinomycetota bacterium]
MGTGTQGNLNFLPERHTDFIFAVLGEELGFIGAIGLLLLYLMLLLTALNIASQSRDLFGTLIAAGIVSMWTFQILQNIGMSIGLMPITGLPLPFMSFGSSFMIVNFAAVGMLLSIWSRRYGA